MPRDGSGIYTKPAGTTAIPNTTIESAKYNSTIDDIAQDLNAARPIVSGGTAATTAAGARRNLAGPYVVKSAGYTPVADDIGAVHRYTATATVSLTAAATLGSGWTYTVIADGGDVTIDPNASETINGQTTMLVPNGTTIQIVCDGTGFYRHSGQIDKWELIGTYSPSNAASVVCTNLSPFRKLRFSGMVSFSSNGVFCIQASTDNGATYHAGATDYATLVKLANGSSFATVNTANGYMAIADASNLITSGILFQFEFVLEEFNRASLSGGFSRSCPVISGGRISFDNAIFDTTTIARNALRLFNNTGNITGFIIAEGVRG